jgi:DNA-binding transcriptional ArsR family regulator
MQNLKTPKVNSRKKLENPVRAQLMDLIEGSNICLSLESFTENIELTKGAIQQHLYFLEKVGMVAHFKIGKNYYYYLKDRIVSDEQKHEMITNTIRYYGLNK